MDGLSGWVKTLSEKILPPVWLVCAIGILCGTLLYFPTKVREKMKLPEVDGIIHSGLSIVFWFILIVLFLTLIRNCIQIVGKKFNRPRLPKFDNLTDSELAVLKILSEIPGKQLNLEFDCVVVKKLRDNSLIEIPYSGVVFLGAKYDSFELTDNGKRFVQKNKKRLSEKFPRASLMLDLVNPFCQNQLQITNIPTTAS